MSRRQRFLDALTGSVSDLFQNVPDPTWRGALVSESRFATRALVKAVPWFLKAEKTSYALIVSENARRDPGGLALEHDAIKLTWRELDDAARRVGGALSDVGVKPGEVVALLGMNSIRYLVNLLGASHAGATVALINHNLRGRALHHAIGAAKATRLICERDLMDHADGTIVPCSVYVDEHDDGRQRPPLSCHDLDAACRARSGKLETTSHNKDQDFVYIYTSGTTGLPKPCRVSHKRAITAAAGFGTLVFCFGPGDKLYCVLPLYHASGLLLGFGSSLLTRTPMAIRKSFSASAFFPDVKRYGATATLYIGELARYLVNAPPSEADRDHKLRVAVGNGMRPDVWERFTSRFGVAVREFYAATEAPGFILNISGTPGSVGRVPLNRAGWLTLVKYDVDEDQHVTDANGSLIPCGEDETGELLVRLASDPKSAITEFRGYTDEAATKKKILTNVFAPGDRYFRTGDLLRRDRRGFFYFVDRIGDTFRCKGENVSTAEVADVITGSGDYAEATVVGIKLEGRDGQAGLCALTCERFDPDHFFATTQELPAYARPRFVRVIQALDTTGTFKIQKTRLKREGVDLAQISDPLFVLDGQRYVPLTEARLAAISRGELRL